MLRPRRGLWILMALILVGGLNAGCRTGTSPTATPTQTGPPSLAQAATSTATSGPVDVPTQAVTPSPTQTPVPTQTALPTTVSPSATPTCSASPSPTPLPTNTLAPTETPTPAATPEPTTAIPAPTATHTRLPPTATPSSYRFLPAGPAQPDPSHPCPTCPNAPAYIVGHIHDTAGNPLAGVRLVCYNEWHRYPVVASKGGGEYDFMIIQADATWYVVVVDQADQPISPEVAVHVDLNESCRYVLDWQQVH